MHEAIGEGFGQCLMVKDKPAHINAPDSLTIKINIQQIRIIINENRLIKQMPIGMPVKNGLKAL
jgi:hypothetical protein